MNQIVTKAVEELSSEMVAFEEMTPPEEKALKRPQIITAIFTQKLTEVYMAGRSDAAEYIDSLATTEDLPFGVYRGVVRQPHKWPELIEQAKQPVKITTDCMNLRKLLGICEHKWQVFSRITHKTEEGRVTGAYDMACEKCGNIKRKHV